MEQEEQVKVLASFVQRIVRNCRQCHGEGKYLRHYHAVYGGGSEELDCDRCETARTTLEKAFGN